MEKPIRILQVTGIMDLGGAENLIMNIYRHLDRSKIQFDFVENSESKGYFDDEITSLGGKIYHCPHYNGKNHFTYKKWWKDFFSKHSKEYRIVHGHIGSTAAIYLSIAKKYGLYTIAHSHNTHGKDFRSFLYRVYSYPTRYIADYFFACSYEAGKDRFGERIVNDPTKFSLLKNAIDTDRFKYDLLVREEYRDKLEVQDKKVVGHIGRFVGQKNQAFLIDIFKEIYDSDSSYVLLMIGEGPDKEEIKNRVKFLGVDKNVIIMNPVSDVEKYYQAMDVFVLPSLFEGLALVTVEAQCSGLKLFLSDTISKECIVTSNQVRMISLSKSPKQWAKEIMESVPYVRKDGSYEVVKNGFDAHNTTKSLQNFYLKIHNRG